MSGELSIKEYFLDLFNTFNFDKDKIHDQVKRDLHRMIININGTQIKTIEQFYKLLNNLDISLIYKRMLWVLPTQVSMVYFYFYLHNYYIKKKNTYAVAELSDSNRYSNDFIINIDIIDSNNIDIHFIKNFRVLDTSITSIPTIYNIFVDVDIKIGKSKMIYFKWKEVII